MNESLRPQRNLFLLFLGMTFITLMSALPLVVAQNTEQADPKPSAAQPSAAQGATAPQSLAPEHPGFEQADRNKDGFLDKSEAGVIPGLSANFERADRNRDGKLDPAEFEKGLQILQVRR
jgi:hypothetical protein